MVIGGDYVGLEAAAVDRKLGLEVTVVEMAPRILQRVAAAETADFFRDLHSGRGVTIMEATAVDRLLGDERVSAVRLRDGRDLPADFVIAGIGISPRGELAEAAGIALENGIRTDAQGWTSATHVWAAGDCASFPMNGKQLRLGSVGNAIDHAELIAANILGAARDYVPRPWFWSDQYDCKLQITGLNAGYDRVISRLVNGTAASFWYYAGDRLLAVNAMSDPRAFMVGKRLIEDARTANPALIADTGSELKALQR